MWHLVGTNQFRSIRRWGIWFWLSLGCGVKLASADVLYFATDLPPLSGRLIEETAESVTFQVRLANGSTKIETIRYSLVARIIRTINLETLNNSQTSPSADVLAYAETLLSIHQDLEAQHCGQELLTELLQRESLTDEWKQAICRLQLQALPPGLARERLKQQRRTTGLYTEPPSAEQDAADPWHWFVIRLSADTQTEWRSAMRLDRESTGTEPPNQVPVPRAEIQRRLRQTQATLVVGDPVHRWTTELLAELDSDDLTALVTLARLESNLFESQSR